MGMIMEAGPKRIARALKPGCIFCIGVPRTAMVKAKLTVDLSIWKPGPR
jgi:hypothetical protein